MLKHGSQDFFYFLVYHNESSNDYTMQKIRLTVLGFSKDLFVPVILICFQPGFLDSVSSLFIVFFTISVVFIIR